MPVVSVKKLPDRIWPERLALLTGTFSEAVHGGSGDVSGRVAGGHIETSVDALGFSAHLSVSTQGKRQSVSIRPADGDVESVTITMQRI